MGRWVVTSGGDGWSRRVDMMIIGGWWWQRVVVMVVGKVWVVEAVGSDGWVGGGWLW